MSSQLKSKLCSLLALSQLLAPGIIAPAIAQGPAVNSTSPSKPPTSGSPSNSSAFSNSTNAQGADGVAGDKQLIEPIKLTDESVNHEANKTLNLSPLYLSTAVEMNSFRALRQEASFDQSIRLADAIRYVLDHGMQIKISKEELIYQHWQTLAQMAGALPNFTMQYNLTNTDVYNSGVTSIGRQFLTGLNFPVFQGGGTMNSILAQYYRERAWKAVLKSTVEDVFLAVYQDYINLLLQRVLLQIWAKAVEADLEQLRITQAQLKNGSGTRFAVLQSEAQLAADRQSFLQQQVAMRQAALTLNSVMNFPMAVNLIPIEQTLTEASIFSDNVDLKTLIQDALTYNPGLRQYELFRLVANRQMSAVAANYSPSVSFFVLWQFNDTGVNPPNGGSALGGVATAAIDSFLNSTFAGRLSNNALGQQFTFSPTAGPTASQGANTGPSAMPAAAGGTPIALIQSGSAVSSGAVAASVFGGGNGGQTGPNTNGSLQAPSGIFPGLFREVQLGFSLSWSLPGAGIGTAAQLLATKTLARQTMMQMNQEIGVVTQNVRSDFLAMKAARQSIDKAAAAVASSREALRLARSRMLNGVGTNLDVIQAQKIYIQNLTAQAQAIVASNVAQAQLLHDMGMISDVTLTSGYHPGHFDQPRPTKKIHWIYP